MFNRKRLHPLLTAQRQRQRGDRPIFFCSFFSSFFLSPALHFLPLIRTNTRHCVYSNSFERTGTATARTHGHTFTLTLTLTLARTNARNDFSKLIYLYSWPKFLLTSTSWLKDGPASWSRAGGRTDGRTDGRLPAYQAANLSGRLTAKSADKHRKAGQNPPADRLPWEALMILRTVLD